MGRHADPDRRERPRRPQMHASRLHCGRWRLCWHVRDHARWIGRRDRRDARPPALFSAQKKVVPAGEMWAGMPARKFRDLREGEDKMALIGSAHYVEEARLHMAALDKR